MEFQIITTEDNSFFISDTYTVEGFDKHGKKLLTGIPSKKDFREMAYILPPIFLKANSFENAKEKFIAMEGNDHMAETIA